jgi:hypothetical protein
MQFETILNCVDRAKSRLPIENQTGWATRCGRPSTCPSSREAMDGLKTWVVRLETTTLAPSHTF